MLILAHADETKAARDHPVLAPDDCTTREHLSRAGKQVLARLNNRIRGSNVTVGRVLTSHDCRCVETAGILFARAQPWSIIDDSGQLDTDLARQRRAALIEAASRWTSEDNLALVTHRTVIRETFDISLAPAELLLIEPLGDEGFRVIGRLSPGTDF